MITGENIMLCDWQNPEIRKQLERLTRFGFAAQFLIRNPEYQLDYARMLRRVGAEEHARFAGRWGLRFPL
jgi:hypothetical protein